MKTWDKLKAYSIQVKLIAKSKSLSACGGKHFLYSSYDLIFHQFNIILWTLHTVQKLNQNTCQTYKKRKWHLLLKKSLCRQIILTELLLSIYMNYSWASLPSLGCFVLPLPPPSVFWSLHLPSVSELESSLLLHSRKHNQCFQDQSTMTQIVLKF